MSNIKIAIEQFDPIDLREMADVNLMNRVDTKFAFRQDDLLRFLPILAADYRALLANSLISPELVFRVNMRERYRRYRSSVRNSPPRQRLRKNMNAVR